MFASVYQPAPPASICRRAGLSAPPTRDPERAALRHELVALASAFSPRYESHGAGLVVIDVGGLGRLLGPAHAIGDALWREAQARHLPVQMAVASTQTAAIVLACARPGLTVVAADEARAALASLPIEALCEVEKASACGHAEPRTCKSEASASASVRGGGGAPPPLKSRLSRSGEGCGAVIFHQWGLRTLGELAALPAAQLVARLGRPALAWQAMARGEDQRPLVPDVAEERFEASLDLEWPIEGLEPLSFVLTRLLEPLSVRLERRDRGVAVLHVQVQLVTRAATGLDRDVHARRLELPAPVRDVRALRTLALLDLESHPPGAAIDRVTVVLEPTPGRTLQHTLFARPEPSPDELATLMARLGAVMGQDRVGAPVEVDSHRPGAFGLRAFAPPGARPATPAPPAPLAQALRRYRQPLPARVTVSNGVPVRLTLDRRGAPCAAIVQASGPWRASGDWWVPRGRESTLDRSTRLRSPRAASRGEAERQRSAASERGCRLRAFGASASLAEARALRGRAKAGGPARSRSEAYDRDEWDVALGDGTVYRLVQDRETAGWFVEAMAD